MNSSNPFLLNYCRRTIEKLGGDNAYSSLLDENLNQRKINNEEALNIAVINGDNNFNHRSKIVAKLSPHVYEQFNYESHTISPASCTYDRLLFPFIFINGKGGAGYLDQDADNLLIQNCIDHYEEESDKENEEEDTNEKIVNDNETQDNYLSITTFIRLTTKSLLMQKYDHWIHSLGTLREEWLVSQFGRIIYFATEFQLRRQKLMAKEKAISDGSAFIENEKDEGIKFTIPRTLQSSSSYWSEVENDGFLLSAKFGAPNFFLTLTMNLEWNEFKDIKEFDPYHNGAAISRIFKIRFHRLLKYLSSSQLFGKIHAYIWRIEYQQRGLPHAHE